MRLGARQADISGQPAAPYVGRTLGRLVGGRDQKGVTARTAGGRLVHFTGDEKLIGTYQNLTITGCSTWALFGDLAE